MKNRRNVFYLLLIILAGVIYFPVQAQQNGTQNVVYQLDIKKSKLFWQAPKNRHNGFILFNSGALSSFINDRPTRGTFSINMNSMRSTDAPTATGRKKVDDELRSENFFAVSRYPTATMLVKQIFPEQKPATYRVLGELTIKGVTKAIEFITIMKQNGSSITATANMNITRTSWNINHEPTPWNVLGRLKDNLVDEEIPVNLELIFRKK